MYIKNPRQAHGAVQPEFQNQGGMVTYLAGVISYIGQQATEMQNMEPNNYYDNFASVRNMASGLVGSINQSGHPSYIQDNDPGLGPDQTIPQHAPRGRGRGRRQRNRANNPNEDNEGEGNQQFGGTATNYGIGTSNVGGATPNYKAGPSTDRGATPHYGANTSQGWSDCYRPSYEYWGQGSSSAQPCNPLDVYQTPSSNMIPPIYSNQQGGFQNYYEYTGQRVQQPRFPNVSPVPMSYGSMVLPPTQPQAETSS